MTQHHPTGRELALEANRTGDTRAVLARRHGLTVSEVTARIHRYWRERKEDQRRMDACALLDGGWPVPDVTEHLDLERSIIRELKRELGAL